MHWLVCVHVYVRACLLSCLVLFSCWGCRLVAGYLLYLLHYSTTHSRDQASRRPAASAFGSCAQAVPSVFVSVGYTACVDVVTVGVDQVT